MCGKLIDVAIGALCEQRDGELMILISRRLKSAVYAGYWELPGGKVHEDESPRQCLVREFHEELGIDIQVGQALDIVEHLYPHGHVRLHPFYCSRLRGEPQNIQVAEHQWIRPADLASVSMPEANTPIVQQIMVELNRQRGPTPA